MEEIKQGQLILSIAIVIAEKRYCLYSAHENIEIQKRYWLCLSSRVPTDNYNAHLFLGDSSFLLYIRASRTKSWNSTIVLTLQSFS